ncbi:MAG TPA: polyprenyl synthetase family protein [Elusimicrobiota bacterium]|nr:polyprenyl synthetase family protein [Elusimicrobiota bacterium]
MTPVPDRLRTLFPGSPDRRLSSFVRDIDGALASFSREQSRILAPITRYIFQKPGKRIRPLLVHLCSRVGRPSSSRAVLEAALAVEMIHIATLIHDDLVDAAALRHHEPTVTVRFGEGMAVLMGDFVFSQAFEKLARLGRTDLIRVFTDSASRVCEGEIGQMQYRHRLDISEEIYLRFIEDKTASLMAAACRVGALQGGLSPRGQRALEEYGRLLGMAFQVSDDVLDIEGQERSAGKTLRTDFLNGKMTLPLIHYRRSLRTVRERETFRRLMSSPDGRLSELMGCLRRSGSLDYARQRADRYTREAQQSLRRLPPSAARDMLGSLAERLGRRKA